MRTGKQVLGDLGEYFVANQLRNAGFAVELIGGNFPGYDIVVHHPTAGTGIRVQVKTWNEARLDSYLAKVSRLHLADVYVLVRADDPDNLQPYVFLAEEIAQARQISETPPDFPFTRDPGVKNPTGVKFWARSNWRFCRPDRLGAWHLVKASPLDPISSEYDGAIDKLQKATGKIAGEAFTKTDRSLRNGVEKKMPAQIDPFHAITIGALAHRLASEGRSVIHMEYGQPSTGAPSAAIAAAHRVLDSEAMGYWESAPLKERIARSYAEQHGVAIAPEQVILTCGASPALVLALNTLFAPGARVAVARPGYVAYRNTLKALHIQPLELECGDAERFQLTAAALAALDPAPDGVIVASPANPTGTIIARDELAAIARVCAERNIRIVSDEIYHGISYVGPVDSMLRFAPDALVVNSFSKYFSMAGWRLGWLVVPPDLVGPARARMGNLFLTPPSLAQHAGLAAFDCRDELEGHVATYAKNRELMLAALPAMGLSHIAPPHGAFYIYADVGHLTNDSLAFCKHLLEDTGIASAPGIDFDPVHGNRYIRFSFAVSSAEVEDALARLGPWLAAQEVV